VYSLRVAYSRELADDGGKPRTQGALHPNGSNGGSPATKLRPISPEATAFARIGEPSYAGITGEAYVGPERRESGTVTLEGNWRSSRQYLALQNGAGEMTLVVNDPGLRAFVFTFGP
jgi:hypothetical protein